MLDKIPIDVLGNITHYLDACTVYAVLPQVCKALHTCLWSQLAKRGALMLTSDLNWRALASSIPHQVSLRRWLTRMSHLHSLTVHVGSFLVPGVRGGVAIVPQHRDLSLHAVPWAPILTGLPQLLCLTLSNVDASLLHAISQCTQLQSLRLRVVGPCTKEALTHGLAALGTLLHLQHMEVNATQWTRTPKHTTTTTAMQATAHARNAAYTQGTVPAHAHALANAPSQSSSHISLYRAVSDDSDDDTQASCRAFFNSNEEEEGNYTGVYDTQEDDVSVRELSSTSVLLPLPGATITSNHRNHHHHTRAMHQDAQTEQHQQDGARDDRPVWVGPLVTGGGGASMVPSAAAAYPEKMLPKGLTTLVLHIGPSMHLPASLPSVSTLHTLSIHSTMRPEFPVAILDTPSLQKLEYTSEWAPRGTFDTIMHMLVPPFLLPADLSTRLPALQHLVLRGCQLGAGQIQHEAVRQGIAHVEVHPREAGTCVLQRNLLLTEGPV